MGWFSGPIRWLFGRFGKPESAATDPLILDHTFSLTAREEAFPLAGRSVALAMSGREHTYQMSR